MSCIGNSVRCKRLIIILLMSQQSSCRKNKNRQTNKQKNAGEARFLFRNVLVLLLKTGKVLHTSFFAG